MSIIKGILEGADHLEGGAQPLDYLCRLVDEIGSGLCELGYEQEEWAPVIRRALEATNTQVEERGY